MDLNLSNDPYDSYRIFQSRIIEQYESMVKPEDFTVINGTSGIEEQHLGNATVTYPISVISLARLSLSRYLKIKYI